MADAGMSAKFRFGPYVPLLRARQRVIVDSKGVVDYYQERDLLARKLLGEILPDDSIVDAPSMVVPLLLKKKTIWPPRIDEQHKHERNEFDASEDVVMPCDNDDDIQLIKIVNRVKPVVQNQQKHYKLARDYIKTAVVQKMIANEHTTLAIQDYYQSSTSDLLLGIGLSQVQEFVLGEKYRKLASKVKRGATALINEEKEAKTRFLEVQASNRPFKSDLIYRCPHCPFRSDSRIVYDGHLEVPHKLTSRVFRCNWCAFKTKDKNQMTYHTYMIHRKRTRIEKPLPLHCCYSCEFGTNLKHKYTSHISKCEKNYDKNSVQALDSSEGYSAVTPKPIDQEDIRTYELVLKDLRLAAYNPHQIEVSGVDSQKCILLLPRESMHDFKKLQASISQLSSPFTSNPISLTLQASSAANQTHNQFHQITQSLMTSGGRSNDMASRTCALVQHPKPNSVFSSAIFAVKNAENVVMAPTIGNSNLRESNQNQTIRTPHSNVSDRTSNPIVIDIEQDAMHNDLNEAFVICEICDAYIENLLKFKLHMLEVHQVKIHKPLGSMKPPLNCQKCRWRFYTDQGLERHLLGSHGLVTQSLQSKTEKRTDSGRCTRCGRKFAKNLVAHMKDEHRVMLKPAELSYKCKVCSAIYGLYSHFENHVYRVHSETC